MAPETLVASLGHSIGSKTLADAMHELDLTTTPSTNGHTTASGEVYSVRSANAAKGVRLTFDGYRFYERRFGAPLARASDDEDELILVEIDFEKTKSRMPWPFDLVAGDPADVVTKKIGKKPYERSSDVPYGQAWWFRFDEHRVLAALDKALRLTFLRFMRLELAEKEQVRLKAHLAALNRNIKPDNAKAVLTLGKALPTAKWRERMKGGDDAFTKAGIDEVAGMLEAYVATLAELTAKKSATPIHNSVKKLVIALNKLNTRREAMIETMEREELAAFINALVRATGLEAAPDVDLTEPWRDW